VRKYFIATSFHSQGVFSFLFTHNSPSLCFHYFLGAIPIYTPFDVCSAYENKIRLCQEAWNNALDFWSCSVKMRLRRGLLVNMEIQIGELEIMTWMKDGAELYLDLRKNCRTAMDDLEIGGKGMCLNTLTCQQY
jgi:hypothetical protein